MPNTPPKNLKQITFHSSSQTSWIFIKLSNHKVQPKNRSSNQQIKKMKTITIVKTKTHTLQITISKYLCTNNQFSKNDKIFIIHTAIDGSQIAKSMIGPWAIKIGNQVLKKAPRYQMEVDHHLQQE